MYAEFEARCKQSEWHFDSDPCKKTCRKNQLGPELKSNFSEAVLLEHMNVSCTDTTNFMIGSGEIVCGQRGWLSNAKLHCPDLEDIVSPLLKLIYTGGDKNAIDTFVRFKCRNGELDGPERILLQKRRKLWREMVKSTTHVHSLQQCLASSDSIECDLR
ncbi:hypothetical protein OSTOST_07863, partial [Ostertagia ostertagi]